MLKTIGLVIVVVVVGILLFATTRPDTFRIERSATIQAPPEKVFALLNDFRNWGEWSPWEKKDPAMKRTFGATTSGQGAHYAWEGNKDVGQGSMTMTESVPPTKLALNLDFVKPFEAHHQVEFTLAKKGDGTRVTWAMHGPVPYVSKILHLFFDIDKMVGGDFEAGLANLKALAEKAPAKS